MTQLLSTPFTFDTEFDADGGAFSASTFRPIKRAYTPGEVDALVAQARSEARMEALAEADSLRAMALSAIGQALGQAIPTLAHIAQVHREQSAELALAAARVVASSALDRFPQAPLRAALEALGQEIDASPRLVVRAGQLDDAAREAIQTLCADAGFAGVVAFRDGAGATPAAFELEWADGRAAFEPTEAFERISRTLASALASEAGHAEHLNDPANTETIR